MTLKAAALRALKPRKAFHSMGKDLQSMSGHYGEATLPAARQAISLVFHFHNEVGNGGFAQYFTNSAGRDCRFVLEHLQNMGCGKQHDLLLQMVVALEAAGVDPRNRNQVGAFIFRDEDMMQLEKRLNAEYFANLESFYSLVEEYALTNAGTLGIE